MAITWKVVAMASKVAIAESAAEEERKVIAIAWKVMAIAWEVMAVAWWVEAMACKVKEVALNGMVAWKEKDGETVPSAAFGLKRQDTQDLVMETVRLGKRSLLIMA